MTYRSILVLMEPAPAGSHRARLGAELARRWEAQLTGVFLTSELMLQFGAGEALYGLSPADIDWILRDYAKGVEAGGETAREHFQTAAKAAGVDTDFLNVSGDDPGAFISCARLADLVIMPSQMAIHMGQRRVTAANLAMASGGPVLVTPLDDYAPPAGQRILVAWNGSREAARALRDGWPFIESATNVQVLVVSPTGEDASVGMLQRLFDRHGVKADIIFDKGRDEHAADVIERRMAELDVDLLIAGLYGHPRVQELVLGGVSRQLLHDVPAPMLFSH